jgi:hypothetical protein
MEGKEREDAADHERNSPAPSLHLSGTKDRVLQEQEKSKHGELAGHDADLQESYEKEIAERRERDGRIHDHSSPPRGVIFIGQRAHAEQYRRKGSSFDG